MQNAKSVAPLAGYITLKIIDPETKTASGLEIPDTAQEKPQMGKVLAIGIIPKEQMMLTGFENNLDSVKFLEFQEKISNGDIVIFKKYAGHPVKIKGEEVQIVEFKDILGKIEYES